MKLPRWLVISMLASSVLSVLTAAGWWWVTWPERTIHEFLNVSQAGKWEELNRMYGEGTNIQTEMDDEATEYWTSFFRSLRLEPRGTASVWDIVRGRRRFRLFYKDAIFDFAGHAHVDSMELTVERGRVIP